MLIYKLWCSVYTDRFPGDSADLLLHCEDVKQRLRWMFTDSIASIDDRLA